MNFTRFRTIVPIVTCAALLSAAALGGCASPKSAKSENTATQPVAAPTGDGATAYTDNFDLADIPETATYEDIQKYCLNCHLTSDEETWTAEEVTPALVDSMLFPTLNPNNDPAVEQAVDQSISNYYANKN